MVVLLFLQLATQQLQLQNGMLHVICFLHPATQRMLQEKLLRVTWALYLLNLRSKNGENFVWRRHPCNAFCFSINVYSYQKGII